MPRQAQRDLTFYVFDKNDLAPETSDLQFFRLERGRTAALSPASALLSITKARVCEVVP